MAQQTDHTSNSFDRTSTSMLIALMLGIAVGVSMCSSHLRVKHEQQARAESEYIKKHQCVMAEMRGRAIATYRCDLPEKGTYISSGELARKARDAAQSTTKT